MTAFTFRLESVLRVRTAERELRQRELAAVLAHLKEVERAIAEIQAEINQARQERAIQVGQLQVEQLRAADSYEAQLRDRRQGQESLRDQATLDVNDRREALLAADRAVRSLEILREADFEQFQAEQRRRETRDLDELATRPFSSS